MGQTGNDGELPGSWRLRQELAALRAENERLRDGLNRALGEFDAEKNLSNEHWKRAEKAERVLARLESEECVRSVIAAADAEPASGFSDGELIRFILRAAVDKAREE